MEIFEFFFQFWFLEMVYMDSNMIEDCKRYEKKAKEETKASVQTIAEAFKELFELVSVSGQPNDVHSVGYTHIKRTFNQ